MRLNHFDPEGPLDTIKTSEICSAASKQAARAGVTQSAALLKNTNNQLPLKEGTNVAVIGPNGKLDKVIAGYYGGNHPCDMKFWTAVDSVQQYAKQTTFETGVAD